MTPEKDKDEVEFVARVTTGRITIPILLRQIAKIDDGDLVRARVKRIEEEKKEPSQQKRS